jgi:hypothetical protein
MPDPAARAIFRELRALGCLRVTGSYASGTQTEDSDIDFFVSGDLAANMERIKAVFRKYYVQYDQRSPNTCSCSAAPITTPCEFSDAFAPKAQRLDHVSIFGVRFETY